MKLCIIGAGAAGLCAARWSIEFGCEVTVFEQTNEIGGTWVYNEEVGRDKNGLDVHSSMYKGLHTNLPKEIMGEVIMNLFSSSFFWQLFIQATRTSPSHLRKDPTFLQKTCSTFYNFTQKPSTL